MMKRRPDLYTLAALAVLALYVGARVWRLADSCLWFDEIFGVHAARHAWGGLWDFAAADLVHPPLFYALLKIWVAAGGESPGWLRLLPFVFGVAAVVPLLLLARELCLRPAESCLALLLAAANGFLIKYAQEVRMYGLLLLLALCSLWLFARHLKRGRARGGIVGACLKADALALFFVNLLLVYAHYYGWLVVACEALFLLWRDRARLAPFLLSTAALLACYAPWVYACVEESGAGGGLAQNVGWIERPGPAQLAQVWALLHEPFYFRRSSVEAPFARAGALAGLLLVGLPVLLLALSGRRGKGEGGRGKGGEEEDSSDYSSSFTSSPFPLPPSPFPFLVFFSVAPVALAFALSWVLPFSVWGTRHLIVVAGPYLLLAGMALVRLRPAWLKSLVLVLLGCWFFLAGALTLLRREGEYVWCAWEGLAVSLTEEGRGGAANVYAFEDLVAYHLWFALEGRGDFRVSVVKGVPGVKEDPAYFLPRRFQGVGAVDANSLGGETFWAAFRAASLDETRPPLNLLREKGYRVEKIFEAGARGERAFLVRMSRAP